MMQYHEVAMRFICILCKQMILGKTGSIENYQ